MQPVELAGRQCAAVGIGLLLAGEVRIVKRQPHVGGKRIDQRIAVRVHRVGPVIGRDGERWRNVVRQHDLRLEPRALAGKRSFKRHELKACRRGKIDAVERDHVDVVAGFDVGRLIDDRRDGLHAVDLLNGLDRFVVEQRDRIPQRLIGRPHVDLGEAAHALDALAVRLLIAETHGDQHHDAHDADGHGKRRQERPRFSPPEVDEPEAEQIRDAHPCPPGRRL